MNQSENTSGQAYPKGTPQLEECICGGVGSYRLEIEDINHPWFGQVFPCICRQTRITTGMQEKIGSDLQDVWLDGFIPSGDTTKKMYGFAWSFVRAQEILLTYYGRNGTGKTTLLMMITNELHKRSIPALYLTAYDAMSYIKDGIGKQNGPDDRINKLASVRVLLLDEVSQSRWTEYTQESLETVLDKRYRTDLPTVIALDQDPEDVLSPRFTSRLKSGYYICVDGANDWRPIQGEEKTKRADLDSVWERGE